VTLNCVSLLEYGGPPPFCNYETESDVTDHSNESDFYKYNDDMPAQTSDNLLEGRMIFNASNFICLRKMFEALWSLENLEMSKNCESPCLSKNAMDDQNVLILINWFLFWAVCW